MTQKEFEVRLQVLKKRFARKFSEPKGTNRGYGENSSKGGGKNEKDTRTA